MSLPVAYRFLNRRPIVGFTGIEGSANLGMLIYHGFQARIEHRYSGGLYLLNAFPTPETSTMHRATWIRRTTTTRA